MAPKTKSKQRAADTIENISKPAWKRILHKAGVKRIKSEIYDQLGAINTEFLRSIIQDAIIYAEHNKRKTVKSNDLKLALHKRGIELAAGINKNARHTETLKSCNARGRRSKKSEESEENAKKLKEKKKVKKEPKDGKKPHRFKPGTVVMRDIKKNQKRTCLLIPKLNFSRLVRSIANEFSDVIRFAEGVFDLLQLVAENYIVSICMLANEVAAHASRVTLIMEDIDLVIRIQSKNLF